MEIKPFGHRVLVKVLENETAESGLVKPEGIEPEFCSWGRVIALPEHKENAFINSLIVGDLVAFAHFSKDKIIDPETNEEFLVLEVERDGGVKGQIWCVKHERG